MHVPCFIAHGTLWQDFAVMSSLDCVANQKNGSMGGTLGSLRYPWAVSGVGGEGTIPGRGGRE